MVDNSGLQRTLSGFSTRIFMAGIEPQPERKCKSEMKLVPSHMKVLCISYVGRGTGQWGPRFRLGARAEIVKLQVS